MSDSNEARDVYADIRAERVQQDAQWGGPEHDDSHEGGAWLEYIEAQARKAWRTVTAAEYRERLVKIAALAVAAIESHDRKSAMNPTNPEADNG
jgi:hypothetical protein